MTRFWWAAGGIGLWLIAGVGAPLEADEASPSPPAPFRYDPGNRRDPFMPLVRDGKFVGATPGLRWDGSLPMLQGILWDPAGQSIALINDGEVGVGDTVEGYQVIEIRSDGVVLSDGGEPVLLQLEFEMPSSQPPPSTSKGGGGR